MATSSRVAPRDLPDVLLSEGTSWVTTDEVARRLQVSPDRVPDSLERARAAGRILSITKGAWLVVPPEYLGWGAPPPTHFIDAWMRHLDHPYYVGLLSSAAHHGIVHHAAQTFQVVTAARLRDRTIGRTAIEFVRALDISGRPTVTAVVPTGQLVVSAVEVTLLDLVAYPNRSGGLANVATIVATAMMEDRFDAAKLVTASVTYRPTVMQRLGHLAETAAQQVGLEVDLEPVARHVAGLRVVPLDVRGPRASRIDPRWRVHLNADVEVDA